MNDSHRTDEDQAYRVKTDRAVTGRMVLSDARTVRERWDQRGWEPELVEDEGAVTA